MFINIKNSVLDLLTSVAYEPVMFYGIIILIITLATFGLPISEEIVIVSAALVTYMGQHPELYPPSPFAIEEGLIPVQPITTAIVCFLAVFLSDLLVYMLGFIFREKILNYPLVQKTISQKKQDRIDKWILKYGHYVSGIFRFTPGLRFIGYLSCGIVRIPIDKFILINGLVALLIVPSQVIIISIYGETIIENLKSIFIIVITLFCLFIFSLVAPHIHRFIKKKKDEKE